MSSIPGQGTKIPRAMTWPPKGGWAVILMNPKLRIITDPGYIQLSLR